MIKKVLVGIAILAVASVANADLYWENGAAITDDGGTPLTPGYNQPTVGCFAQLIQTATATANPFVNSGSGVSGGDTVVATMYCSQNNDLEDAGIFTRQPTAAVSGDSGNGYYYVRVFDAAQSTLTDWNLGVAAPIPTTATAYFESSVHQYEHNATLPDYWDFAPTGGATDNLIAVPEPTTLAFLGLGAVAFFARKRMRS